MLLALVQLHDCVAARVLKKAGIVLDAVAREVATRTPPRGAVPDDGRLPLAAGVVRAIELASAAAHDRLGHPSVGTGHLLLGLLEEAEGMAFAVLCKLGIGRLGGNLSRIAEHVIVEMTGGERPSGPGE